VLLMQIEINSEWRSRSMIEIDNIVGVSTIMPVKELIASTPFQALTAESFDFAPAC
jgi:hypothetical protein